MKIVMVDDIDIRKAWGKHCSHSLNKDTLIVLDDFNAVTGTERADYELCVGPHGSGTRQR